MHRTWVSKGELPYCCATPRHPPRRDPNLTTTTGFAIVTLYPLHTSIPSHMPVVLPGEAIQTQHKTLKLGPGLQQIVDSQGRSSVVVTRAGTLEQNPKGNKFWVEGNSRRVCLSLFIYPSILPYSLFKVCARGTRARCRHCECSTGRGLESGHRLRPSCVP